MTPRSRALTLVELLVVVSIIALLMTMVIATLGPARESARMARELSAGRTLMFAWSAYADDQDGLVLPGYMPGQASDDRGRSLTSPQNKRYPWKLAPYLGNDLSDSLLVNTRREDIDALRESGDNYSYAVSVMPSLGINAQYVGGHELFGWLPHVRHIDEPVRPAELIVFASARATPVGPGQAVEGYFEIRPPMDRQYDAMKDAYRFGFVHPRYNGAAVTAWFDGHASLIDQNSLHDMRHWANAAARDNNPDWMFSTQSSRN